MARMLLAKRMIDRREGHMLTGKRYTLVYLCLVLACAGITFEVGAAQAEGVTKVLMVEYTYDPKVVTIPAGSTVIWHNAGKEAHTATLPGVFDTGSVAPGAEVKVTLTTPGTFRYVCRFHGGPTGEGMNGTIIVTARRLGAASSTITAMPTSVGAPPAHTAMPGAGAPALSLAALSLAALAVAVIGLRLRRAA